MGPGAQGQGDSVGEGGSVYEASMAARLWRRLLGASVYQMPVSMPVMPWCAVKQSAHAR